MFRYIIDMIMGQRKKVEVNISGEIHHANITPPEGFNGQIALQGTDTETSVYVFKQGRVIRQYTLPAKYCCRLACLGSLETRSSPA